MAFHRLDEALDRVSRLFEHRLLALVEVELDDLFHAVAGLKQLSGQTGRGGGELQLEWANALADSFADADNKRLEESSQLAKILIVNTHADSELHWGARWRLSKNQLLLGQAAEAQQAAQLLLATQPPTAEVWKSRFAELVK